MKSASERKLQFLDPPREFTNFEKARVVILPIPFEKTTSYVKGTALGPDAIVEASTQVEFFDPELRDEPCRIGIATDWSLADPDLYERPTEDILRRISVRTGELLDRGKFVLALGGEHTITVGLMEPYLERYKDRLTVVQVDAHADLRDEYDGTPLSHACAMRRLAEEVPIVSAGVRALEKAEFEAASAFGVKHFYGHQIRQNPGWIDELVASITTPDVYLTFDLDGLDPSVMPSVGTPVPEGLLWHEALAMIRAVARKHRIVGADVNELCPGPLRSGEFAAALLCYKIIGYTFAEALRGLPAK
jgi:agmatinase